MKKFDAQFSGLLCGIDEVGRGPLCGPVVSACVRINDSKKISTIKREKLFEPLKELCIYGIAEASPKEIDQLNIHHATLLAMKRAFLSFRRKSQSLLAQQDPAHRRDDGNSEWLALIDGKFAPELPCATQTVIKGDSLSLSIAAASIIAKVTRDRYMNKLHEEFPYYGWDSNAGYGTKAHMKGLQTHGLTPFHRLSFAPCSKVKANK